VDGCFIVLYADDILLISPSVTQTKLLHCCKQQLAWLDMCINFTKSSCLLVGQAAIVGSNDRKLYLNCGSLVYFDPV